MMLDELTEFRIEILWWLRCVHPGMGMLPYWPSEEVRLGFHAFATGAVLRNDVAE